MSFLPKVNMMVQAVKNLRDQTSTIMLRVKPMMTRRCWCWKRTMISNERFSVWNRNRGKKMTTSCLDDWLYSTSGLIYSWQEKLHSKLSLEFILSFGFPDVVSSLSFITCLSLLLLLSREDWQLIVCQWNQTEFEREWDWEPAWVSLLFSSRFSCCVWWRNHWVSFTEDGSEGAV